MSRFIIKFRGDLADQPGSVVVKEGCQETEVSGSILGGYLRKFSFFFNLVEKNSFTVKKISKCGENGIDRLRNGNPCTAASLAQLAGCQSAVGEVEGSSPRPDQHAGS